MSAAVSQALLMAKLADGRLASPVSLASRMGKLRQAELLKGPG
jgi:hypothetical protein